MGEEFINELANTANKLIAMLSDCDMNMSEYVTDCICKKGYVFTNDLLQMDNEK